MPQILMPYTVHLDHTLCVTPLSTLFAKGDSAAHRFELTILSAGVQEDLTGCKVVCKFYRMAESAVVAVDGTIEDGKAVAVLDSACYDYIGRFALTIAIQKGEDETTVFYGDGYMHGQRADTSISGEYIIYDINTLLEKIAEIDAATQAANTATGNANTATANANTATGNANAATENANAGANNANKAAAKINGMTIAASGLSAGASPTAELSEIDGHYHIALGLPKGDTGATPQISVQVATGAAGSEASVSVSGTAENPVILLTIPRGDVGNIGNLTINGKTPDGSGAVTLTAEDVGALATGGTAADSSKLGGVAAIDYALKTDTAPDSSKLGGKAPEYYLQPRNLLDNSDFRNPVNQRGIASGNVITNAYCIDRWKLLNAGQLTFDDGYITISANQGYDVYFRQFFEKLPKFPVTVRLETTSGIITAKLAINARYTFNDDMYVEIDKSGFLGLFIPQGKSLSIVNIALYEGSYTADTLPEYQPKGYGVELAECQRYFVRLGIDNTYSFIGNGVMRERLKANIGINYNTTMRVLPTITFHGTFMLIPSFQDTTNLSIDCINRMSATIFCTIMSERPIGEACILNAKPNEMSYVDISADL